MVIMGGENGSIFLGNPKNLKRDGYDSEGGVYSFTVSYLVFDGTPELSFKSVALFFLFLFFIIRKC